MNVRLSGTERTKLAAKIKADIEAASVAHFKEEPRDHLGASEIGNKCKRALVYSFRWMAARSFDGRMHRLFNRGHMEENRIAQWFSLIGINIEQCDATTGKQFRMEGYGHHGGSFDGGIGQWPKGWNLPQFLVEMKTHNQKSFDKLLKFGMKESKPMHWAQMCDYGTAFKFPYGMYVGVNKNDDDIHIEIHEIDYKYGKELQAKAQDIISAKTLPNRIAGSPVFFDCKFCDFCGICHLDKPVQVNCRSCKNSEARTEAGKPFWFCTHWQAEIPKEAVLKACPHWSVFR